ncbi:MAG TPA: gfo/Idh/MocA family oxidoreductase, partial [Firmicutes bacterium]|nr:gfo/Idh/MocA family oxidoreductase [Bacillota bacterium]
HWDQNDAVPIKTAAGLTKTMAPRTDETIASEALPVVCSDIRDFYRNIVDTLEGKAQQKIQHSEIMRVMKLMEAAFQSAQNNQILPFE